MKIDLLGESVTQFHYGALEYYGASMEHRYQAILTWSFFLCSFLEKMAQIKRPDYSPSEQVTSLIMGSMKAAHGFFKDAKCFD